MKSIVKTLGVHKYIFLQLFFAVMIFFCIKGCFALVETLGLGNFFDVFPTDTVSRLRNVTYN